MRRVEAAAGRSGAALDVSTPVVAESVEAADEATGFDDS